MTFIETLIREVHEAYQRANDNVTGSSEYMKRLDATLVKLGMSIEYIAAMSEREKILTLCSKIEAILEFSKTVRHNVATEFQQRQHG